MMADRRKMGLVRQMSLQCEPTKPPHPSRRILRKQFSEDIPEVKEIWADSVKNIRLTSSAKNRQKTADRPPTAKLAWTEKRQSSLDERTSLKATEDNLITKKCKEVKRPATAKLKKQNSVEKESILYGPQELADRLRKTLNENKEQGKTNLNIFLAHNTKEKFDDELEELTDNESYAVTAQFVHGDSILQDKEPIKDTLEGSPKIIPPLQPDINANNFKNIFQKQIKRTSRARLIYAETTYSPSKKLTAPPNEEIRPNLNVVIPNSYDDCSVKTTENLENSVETNATEAVKDKAPSVLDSRHEENETVVPSVEKNDTSIEISTNQNEHPPLQRAASSAVSRREAFQKRNNTAFTGSTASVTANTNSSRPPLVRALSVPTSSKPPPDHGEKSKFLTRVKRRIKTAKKREKENEDFEYLSELGEDDIEDKNKSTKNKMRYVPPSNEVETMVSLVSPSDSDNEEPEKEKGQRSRQVSPSKEVNETKKAEQQKILVPKKASKTG